MNFQTAGEHRNSFPKETQKLQLEHPPAYRHRLTAKHWIGLLAIALLVWGAPACPGPGNTFTTKSVAQCAAGGLSGATTSLNPTSVVAGVSSATVTITISGTFGSGTAYQFFGSDTILWNGSANGIGTTYVDPSHLKMSVAGNLLTSPGTATITVQETCGNGPNPTSQTNSAMFTIKVAALAITTTSLPNGTVNNMYSQPLSASGGTTPYTWSLQSGTLPAGLTLSSAGVISGTPNTAGTSNFTVLVKDASTPQQTDTKSLSIVISAASNPLSITTASLPNGMVRATYNQVVTASGGTTPYTWSWAAASGSSLPPGLSFNSSTGDITGTPTSTGTFNFTVTVQDSSSPHQTVHQAFSLQINPAQPITYSPGTVLSQSQSGSGPGMLVALDQGINAADNNNGVAVAVIGIPGSPSGPVIASGSAFGTIFIQDTAGNWNAAAQLTAPTTGVYTSVAISGDGNTIVVGSCATTVSPCASNSSGFAYVYTTANNNWTGTLSSPATLSVSNRGLGFGTRVPAVSVDFNGDTIAMGAAPFSTQGTGQGVVAVFLRPAGGWASKNDDVQLTANVVEVGTSVSIDDSGDTIVAGAAVGTQSASEGAFVFIKPSGTQGWAVTTNNGTITTPTATLAQSNGLAGDRFGASVAISGDGHTVAIGTPNYPDCTPFPCNTGGPGAVYVFANPSSPSAWGTMQQPVTENALLTASNGKLGDRLGWSTAVSKDGGTIVSGAQAAPNGSCCTFGPGAIYVFQASGAWSGSVLETQSFTATSTQTVSPQTNFGASTAITGDSTSIGVGGVATVNGTRNQQVVYLFQ